VVEGRNDYVHLHLDSREKFLTKTLRRIEYTDVPFRRERNVVRNGESRNCIQGLDILAKIYIQKSQSIRYNF
jgi:hypothetical protein